jgi:alpha-glucosidase
MTCCMKCVCLLLSLLPLSVLAQDSVVTPGAVLSMHRTGSDIDIRTEHAYVRLTVYSPSVIRVREARQPLGSGWSYAVVGTPAPTTLDWSERGDEAHLRTDSLDVIVHTQPFSLSFHTAAGALINEDEHGLGTSWEGTQVTAYKTLQPGERFVGLGEKTGNLDRAGNAYTNWNSDVFGYSVSQDPLYSTIPFYIGIHHDVVYGIFLDNSYRTDFNFGASNNRFSSFGAQGGELNYYLIYRSTVAGVIRSYTDLTGRMSLPPLWSLGYQQNRYSYYPDAEVLWIARTLREKKIPADGITLDIHYMDHFKLFTWNKDRFPDPSGLVHQLTGMGFRLTTIVDPGVKVEKGYPAYESGLASNIFLKYPDGQNYTGQVWPGWCNFPDFTNQRARTWWAGQLRTLTDAGVSGIWNDMNEVSTWGQKMPDNVLFDFDGHETTHRQGHNVFGLEMARSSYEGARAALGKRPFVLTRSGYAGLQRYAAIWTGDNRPEDDHMMAGVGLLTSLGLSGVPFAGMDVAGFTGDPTPALYTRWMQLGAFLPYFRNHANFNTKAAEPWTFGEDILDITRRYIGLRYTLLPYLYSNFREASQDGMPVLRSLVIDYAREPLVYDQRYQDEFLFGPSILVVPENCGASFAKMYFPPGDWYDAYTGQSSPGGREQVLELQNGHLPVFVKGGGILPVQSLVQSTAEAPSDTLDLHVYQGRVSNSFTYYEDDGESYGYEKGNYYQRVIRFDPLTRSIVLEKVEGQRTSKFKYIRLLLHGFDNVTLKDTKVSFLPGEEPQEKVKVSVFANDDHTITIPY